MPHEIETPQALLAHLHAGRSLDGVRLQGVDLSGAAGAALLAVPGSLEGLVVLGGCATGEILRHLTDRGAIVFPTQPHTPIDPYRARLYTATELYSGLAATGYASTPDARAYAWSREEATREDAYSNALRALHDAAIRDALHELIDAPSVGIMGGHALRRDSKAYRDVAWLAHSLAEGGYRVLTGGGPGAMEAANLGAATRNNGLDAALDLLSQTPTFTPSIDAWAAAGFAARTLIDASSADEAPRSIGVPTWFYGHEPPNVFADAIAKYFSNALREDDLLSASHDAVVVLAGAAGTAQEIFQCLTPMYYAGAETPLPELVLVGTSQWRETLPVWDAVLALAQGRTMRHHIHLVESPVDVPALLDQRRPRR